MTAYKSFRSYRRSNNPIRKINRLNQLISGPRRNRSVSAPVLPQTDTNEVINADVYADQLMAWYNNGIIEIDESSMETNPDTEDTTDDFAEEQNDATDPAKTALPLLNTPGNPDTVTPPTSTPGATLPLPATSALLPTFTFSSPNTANILVTPKSSLSKPTKVSKFAPPTLTDEITDDIDVRHPLSATANMSADDIAKLALAKAKATCPMQNSSALDTINLMDDGSADATA